VEGAEVGADMVRNGGEETAYSPIVTTPSLIVHYLSYCWATECLFAVTRCRITRPHGERLNPFPRNGTVL
jgi:hypothetical protein